MRASLTAGGIFLLFLASVIAGVAFGTEDVPVSDVVQVVSYRAGLSDVRPDTVSDSIVWALRLPRALLALMVGGGLATVGVAMQALVRNPLAEPYILGISAGASAGASLFYLGFIPVAFSAQLSIPLAAFLGALAAILLVLLVARSGSVLSVTRLLLAGVAVSSLMMAISSFVTLASPDMNRVRTVLFWLLGSFNGTTWGVLAGAAPVSVVAMLLVWARWRTFDAMLLGDEPAFNLGVSVEAVKWGIILLSALVTGVLVASSGAIGFVGLIVPHAVRTIVGVSHRRVVPLSFMVGAIFMLWADLGARVILDGSELPVGILTALCGVPFFLFLIRRAQYRFG